MKERVFNIWLAVAAVLYAVIFAMTPWGFDDFTYMSGTSGLSGAGEVTAGIWRNVVTHWFSDTGRLANIICPVFLGLLPHWIFAVLSGFAVWITFFYGIRTAGVRPGSVAAYLLVFLLNFALPWLDFAFTVVFALNYVWTGAMTVAVLYVFFVRRPRTRVALTGAVLLSITAGWMHEGFSVPVLAGLAAWLLWRRGRASKEQFAMMAGYIIGFVFILVAPAVWARLSGTQNLFGKLTFNEIVLHATLFCALPYLFLVVLGVFLCRKKRREALVGNSQLCGFTVFCAAATLTGIAMFYMLYLGPRLGWCGTLTASLGLTALSGAADMKHRVRNNVLSVTMAVCVSANLIGACVLQYDYMKENELITRLYQESESGEVYYDNLPKVPDISFFKTSSRCFNEYMPQKCFSQYYSDGAKELELLPSALSGFDGRDVPACASDSSLYLYSGLLLTRTEPPTDATVLLHSPSGASIESRMRTRPFTASDSSRWYLIIPHAVQMYGLSVTDAVIHVE